MDLTATILIFLVIALIIWDVYLYTQIKNGRKTISIVIKEAAQKYPTIVLAAGVLMGHWFWPQ